jgi:5-formyltetrahydrofolate cyclo-ligase
MFRLLSDKFPIRRDVLFKRDSISEETKKDKDRKIRETLLGLSEFKASHKILLYASFRSEVDTFDLLKYCIDSGKTTVLPKVDKQNNELKLYEIKYTEELISGYLGIPEPDVSEDRLMDVEHMDLIIIPGVAFDEQCSRLGYGKGFYDKLLSRVRGQGSRVKCLIALAYEEQIVESIPSESHDIRMDKIITDKRTIECYGQ